MSQFFDEFSNAAKCFLHMTVNASFPVSPPTGEEAMISCFSDVLPEFFGRYVP